MVGGKTVGSLWLTLRLAALNRLPKEKSNHDYFCASMRVIVEVYVPVITVMNPTSTAQTMKGELGALCLPGRASIPMKLPSSVVVVVVVFSPYICAKRGLISPARLEISLEALFKNDARKLGPSMDKCAGPGRIY